MDFVYGFFGIVLAFIIIIYRFEIYNIMGKIDWAERYLGGTIHLIIFSALIFMIFSFLIMIGQEGVLFNGLEKYFGGK